MDLITAASLATLVAALMAAAASIYAARQVHKRWGTDRVDARIRSAEEYAASSDQRTQLIGIGQLKGLFEDGELDETAQKWVWTSLQLLQPPGSDAGIEGHTEYSLDQDEGQPVDD